MDVTFSGLGLREGGSSFRCTSRNILQMGGTIQVEAPKCRNSGTERARTSTRLGGPTGFCTPRQSKSKLQTGSCTDRQDCNVATRGRQITSFPRSQTLGLRQTPLARAGLQTFPEPRDPPIVQGWHAATGQAPSHSPDTRRSERLAEGAGLGTLACYPPAGRLVATRDRADTSESPPGDWE